MFDKVNRLYCDYRDTGDFFPCGRLQYSQSVSNNVPISQCLQQCIHLALYPLQTHMNQGSRAVLLIAPMQTGNFYVRDGNAFRALRPFVAPADFAACFCRC